MLENPIDKLSLVIDDILIAEHTQEIVQVMRSAIETLAPEQFALLIEALPQDKRLSVWSTYPETMQRSAFVDMGQGTRTSLIQALSDEECFELLAQLDVDEVIEIAEEIPSRLLKYAIKNLDDSQRKLYQQAQQFSVDEVGHWLDYNYVRISEKLKVTSAQLLLQKGLSPYTEDFYAVNKEGVLTGTVAINALIQSDGESTLKTLFSAEITRLNANEELTTAAETVILSGKMSLPVVDENEHFLGRFTVETAYQVKQESQTEQMTTAAGLSTDEDLFASVRTSAKNRGIWLGINLLTAFLASWFIGFFEATLQQVVALAVLMPVVASMGGVSGSQTLTVIVRGLALGQITEQNRKVLLRKELKVGGVNGIIWSIVIGAITYFWFDSIELSFVIALAILLNLLTASASGVMIPALLNKLNIDPALSGAVILTTVTDIVGFVVFLGLGSLLLL
ncbi:magnesium transporter [Colwellia sp. MB02u-18]|uniref:magnesium transporter n=1 Tax=unclassified Colwellia TaxID=196834 RepID=UPI0015F54F4F|nr:MULTISPECIES: magnesium transporter [unclassified Colwellia]MBA6225303.1 magnesium transporter [Colwellia sp. MB3u-45]MBA6267247.1 magnesium transporter [Colwellia sp. MB3u-43]MBA6292365.1 magnesium transporter [Colwellia sp. MB3u-8]MBA6297181.1 magnesium transporter [Colwellia sp. MB02u-9]MBA6307184.1 magnesium transporter [Colwellia sp. MB3u-70]